jgi:hypothetical protein
MSHTVADRPLARYRKFAGERLDYDQDWTAWLDGDTISSHTVELPDDGITTDDSSNTTTATKVWLLGGTAGVTYPVIVSVTTATGRIGERFFEVTVREDPT